MCVSLSLSNEDVSQRSRHLPFPYYITLAIIYRRFDGQLSIGHVLIKCIPSSSKTDLVDVYQSCSSRALYNKNRDNARARAGRARARVYYSSHPWGGTRPERRNRICDAVFISEFETDFLRAREVDRSFRRINIVHLVWNRTF